MANEVVVGVKRIKKSELADPSEEAEFAIQAIWITVGGKELPVQMISSSVVNENGPMIVTIKIAASEYRTTDFLGPDAPERFLEERERVA